MTPQTVSRAQRRRSSCPTFFWILVLTWAVLMVSSNVGRVLVLPEFFVRFSPRQEVAKEPNYYEILDVTPRVDDATLRRLRRKYALELHPDKIGHDPEAKKTFLILQDVFETLADGRKRCEYDKEHKIKGKWPVQTCRDAFREEYRQMEDDAIKRWNELKEENRSGPRGHREGYKPKSSDQEDEPRTTKARERSGRKSDSDKASRMKGEEEPRTTKAGERSGRRSRSDKASRMRVKNERPTDPSTEEKDAIETVTSTVAEIGKGCERYAAKAWAYLYRYSSEVLAIGGTAIGAAIGTLAYYWTLGG